MIASLFAAVTAPALTVLIEPQKVLQPVYGFGGSITYNGDALMDCPKRDKVYQALFSELKLDILRLRNYHDYEGQQAIFERRTRDYARGALKWGKSSLRGGKAPVRLMFTAWSPPARLKSNRLVSGRSDGTDKGQPGATLKRNADGTYAYGDYADWWLSSIHKFRDLVGKTPDYVAIQNEVDITVTYEGCEFLPSEGTKDGHAIAGYDRALEAVWSRFQTLGVAAPKLLGPETFTIRRDPPAPGHVQSFVDPATPGGQKVLSRLFGISYHLYGSGFDDKTPNHWNQWLGDIKQAYGETGKPLFQTEFLEGETLTDVAGMISDHFTKAGGSAYLVWILVRRNDQSGYAAVHYDIKDGTIQRRERYFALRHFSEFVGEGWHLIQTMPMPEGLKVSAFRKDDGKVLSVVAVNPGSTTKNGNFPVDGYRLVQVIRSTQGDGGERWRTMELKSNAVELPARSVFTLRYERS